MRRNRTALGFAGNCLVWFLFYYQPFVDIPGVLKWLHDNVFFHSYRLEILGITALVVNLAWLVPLACFRVIYLLNHPWFESCRIQQSWPWNDVSETPRKVSYRQLIQTALWGFLRDQVTSTVLILVAMDWFVLSKETESYLENYMLAELPAWHVRLAQMFAGFLIFETMFYWSHRALHLPRFYAQYHKPHHNFNMPNAITGTYMHPLDGLFASVLPGLVPFFLLKFHMYTFWMWSVVHVFHSIYDHCGYDFDFCPIQLIPFGGYGREHNFHHYNVKSNFALYFRFWDVLMGTDKEWVEHCATNANANADANVA